jgi:hypothetical protein
MEAGRNPDLTLVPDEEVSPGRPEPGWPRLRRWHGLLWAEWFAHAHLILLTLLVWLGTVWAVPMLAHPLWVLTPGILFALVAGPAFGGVDVIHGVEEFTFAYPVTRTERFLSRLALGGGLTVFISGAGVYLLEDRLADVVVRAFLSAGITLGDVNPSMLLYSLMIGFPFTVFALGFSVALLSTGRTLAFTSWLWGLLGALALMRLAVQWEEQRFERLNGHLSVPLLAGCSVGSLWIAWRLYRRKEAGAGVAPLRIPRSWWGWMLAILGAAAGIGVLIYWFAVSAARVF